MNFPSMVTEARLETMAPFFPTPRRPKEDDRRISGGVIFVIKFDLPWRAAPPEYGPHKTLCTRWRRWSKAGIFYHIPRILSDQKAETHTLMMDSTFCKTDRHACSPGSKNTCRRNQGATGQGVACTRRRLLRRTRLGAGGSAEQGAA